MAGEKNELVVEESHLGDLYEIVTYWNYRQDRRAHGAYRNECAAESSLERFRHAHNRHCAMMDHWQGAKDVCRR